MSALLGLGLVLVQFFMSMSPLPLEWQCLSYGQTRLVLTCFAFNAV